MFKNCNSNTAEYNNNEYDTIMLDTHLHDISGCEVAKKIRDRLLHKKIILTTTYSLEQYK